MIFLEPGRFYRITKLPGNFLDCLECAEVVHKLKEKELLKFECKKLQIRQIGVNGDPPDPMLAGAWYELVELLWLVHNVSWTLWFSQHVFWSELIGLELRTSGIPPDWLR
ncbi:hypothetical protein F2Q69_00024838 [Brassica cretica]|uniref:Uncharacterized protein n=1 Tax=Brassica cretica TaxID=69181 RepID=A0A8S9QAA9_BRACR|nr:hypothetical protein F2Q69_00024838 [Brassica cretica]